MYGSRVAVLLARPGFSCGLSVHAHHLWLSHNEGSRWFQACHMCLINISLDTQTLQCLRNICFYFLLSILGKKRKENTNFTKTYLLHLKKCKELYIFSKGSGGRVRLQPEKCTRLSVIHAFQHSYHKTTRNIHVSLCIAVATIKYMDNPVPWH